MSPSLPLALSFFLLPSAAMVHAAQEDLFASPQASSGGFSYAVAVGDWNSDGQPDLIAPQYFPAALSIALGEGEADFAPPVVHLFGTDFKSIDLGDFDGDGNLDAVLGDDQTGDVFLAFGDGLDGVDSTLVLTAGSRTTDVLVADLNQDSALDVLAVSFTDGFAQALHVFLGDGRGGFAPGMVQSVQPFAEEMAVADVDGDGHLDVVLPSGQVVSILFGDGTGGFGTTDGVVTSLLLDGRSAVGDLDEDGDLDIVSIGFSGAGAFALSLLNDGAGGFTEVTTQLFDGILDFELADIDEDGTLEFVGCAISRLVLASSDGTGGFDLSEPITAGWLCEDVDVADLDLDGDLDFVTANRNNTEHALYLADGPGDFPDGLALPVDTDVVAAVDVNSDGIVDLLAVTSNGLDVQLGTGDGAFVLAGSPIGPGLNATDVVTADFDDDGFVDVAASGFDGRPIVEVWRGNGGGAFAPVASLVVGLDSEQAISQQIEVGDLDGDGVLDLVTRDLLTQFPFFSTNTFSVLFGDGVGGFEPAVVNQTSVTADDFQVVEVNGDAFDDVVFASVEGNFAGVLPSNGVGGFGVSTDYPASNCVDVSVLDLDRDGLRDLLIGRADFLFTDAALDVRPGLPGGGFGSPVSWSVGEDLAHLEPGDVDGDGHIDVVLNGDSGQVVVLRGDGGGGFAAPEFYTGYGRTALLDVDLDGFLDRIDSGLGAFQVTLNRSTAPAGLASFGQGTPGCLGETPLLANREPRVPAADFGLTATGAPPEATGFFRLFDAPSETGFLALDLQVLIDLQTVTVITNLIPIRSDLAGTAFGSLPIPDKPNLIGLSLSAQAFWPWAGQAPCDPSSLGFSSSRGLTLTFLP